MCPYKAVFVFLLRQMKILVVKGVLAALGFFSVLNPSYLQHALAYFGKASVSIDSSYTSRSILEDGEMPCPASHATVNHGGDVAMTFCSQLLLMESFGPLVILASSRSKTFEERRKIIILIPLSAVTTFTFTLLIAIFSMELDGLQMTQFLMFSVILTLTLMNLQLSKLKPFRDVPASTRVQEGRVVPAQTSLPVLAGPALIDLEQTPLIGTLQ